MWIAGQERGSMCLPPSSGPLGLTGGQLEREFPALTQCALLPANRRLASGDMLTDPLKAWKNKKFDMKKRIPSNHFLSGSIHNMKVNF